MVNCAMAVPLWTLIVAGLQLGVITQVSELSDGVVLTAWTLCSIVLGLVCALVAWANREWPLRSGRWIGFAGALMIVGALLPVAGQTL